MDNKDILPIDNIERVFDFNYSKKKIISLHRKSPNRYNNNDRVLSVSGKLRCTRCNDELGKSFVN